MNLPLAHYFGVGILDFFYSDLVVPCRKTPLYVLTQCLVMYECFVTG